MPFDEQVDPDAYRDINLLESSVGRPFQTFGGEDLFPTIPHKAAALFHALVCNHCFTNGNKRTAVLALDFFLIVNGRTLAISNKDIYDLADETAKANLEGKHPEDVVIKLTETLNEQSVNVNDIVGNREAALALGTERINKMIERVEWGQNMILSELSRTDSSTGN
jgi:death-on-curing protein